ncbi:hypothetical protein RB195_016913 [Necator americanus]|uniref:Uncharacterized protein n=1 Tax=Necator americanus TaxID=51031 RepID=A0ABR1C4W9_NECAM
MNSVDACGKGGVYIAYITAAGAAFNGAFMISALMGILMHRCDNRDDMLKSVLVGSTTVALMASFFCLSCTFLVLILFDFECMDDGNTKDDITYIWIIGLLSFITNTVFVFSTFVLTEPSSRPASNSVTPDTRGGGIFFYVKPPPPYRKDERSHAAFRNPLYPELYAYVVDTAPRKIRDTLPLNNPRRIVTSYHVMKLLLCMALIFGIPTVIFFITNLIFSMQWLKNKDECGGSSLFMTYFSFAGTVYFGVDAAFSIIGSLILYFTKKFRMLSRYVLITIVVSFVFVIIEGIALAISILLSLDTSCLNEKPVQTFFVASWILVMEYWKVLVQQNQGMTMPGSKQFWSSFRIC